MPQKQIERDELSDPDREQRSDCSTRDRDQREHRDISRLQFRPLWHVTVEGPRRNQER